MHATGSQLPTGPARWFNALALAVVASACHASDDEFSRATQHALTNGAVDEGDPAVVAIVLASDPTAPRCSGTIIAERVVLTAAHCAVQDNRAGFAVVIGATAGTGRVIRLLDAVAHPGFIGTADHDVALLLLDEPAGVAPVALADSPIIAAAPPVSLRLVGFGSSDGSGMVDGRKREGRSRTSEVLPGSVTVAADPSLPCRGDSGGPAFVGTPEKLAGVVSRGDASCATYGRVTRVDANMAFIAQYLAATGRGVSTEGARCLYDEQCGAGACLVAADAPELRFCGRPCERAADCSAPMTCVERACRYPLPSPGAVGAACTTDAECANGGDCTERNFCSRRCVSGGNTCPTGTTCQLLRGIDFYCVPDPPAPEAADDEGSCALQSRSRASGGATLLAALLLAAIAGRRSSCR